VQLKALEVQMSVLRTAQLVLPTIVFAEMTFLYAKKRIAAVPKDIHERIGNAANCAVYPLDEAVVERLPTNLDIHDAIIVATALISRDILGHQTTVITRDEEITNSALIDVLW
jgi:predicted nucleic acid-binding protein